MFSNFFKGLSPEMKNNIRLQIYKLQTPLLFFIRPKIIESSHSSTEIVIPLNWVTKNSWKTMFFAAIASGADLTGGWAAFDIAEKYKIGVLYKSMNIEFLRRVDGDLYLICKDGEFINENAIKAYQTKERISFPIEVNGYVKKNSIAEHVVKASMILSIKRINKD